MANFADDPHMNAICEKVSRASAALASAAAAVTDNVGDAVAMTLVAAASVFHVTEMLISDKPHPELPLFVGIFAGLCSRNVGDGSVAFNYNPGVIVEALDTFERATGHSAEPFLCPGFVAAGRTYVAKGEAEGDRLLAALQAARKEGRIN